MSVKTVSIIILKVFGNNSGHAISKRRYSSRTFRYGYLVTT